jgi:hypothetical protein
LGNILGGFFSQTHLVTLLMKASFIMVGRSEASDFFLLSLVL